MVKPAMKPAFSTSFILSASVLSPLSDSWLKTSTSR